MFLKRTNLIIMFNLGNKHWNMIYEQGEKMELLFPSQKSISNYQKNMKYIKTQIDLTK